MPKEINEIGLTIVALPQKPDSSRVDGIDLCYPLYLLKDETITTFFVMELVDLPDEETAEIRIRPFLNTDEPFNFVFKDGSTLMQLLSIYNHCQLRAASCKICSCYTCIYVNWRDSPLTSTHKQE